jgi:phosphopantetheinyl transferase
VEGRKVREAEIELYISRIADAADALRANYSKLLTEAELRESDRYLASSARTQFVVSRGLLRRILSFRYDIAPQEFSFGRTGYGKPYLIEPKPEQRLQFNVSHCPSIVAIAIGEAETIGVDVETMNRRFDVSALSAYCMSDFERRSYDAVGAPDRQRAFLRYWTAKEACAKALGVGLNMNLCDVNCWFNDDDATFGFSYPRHLRYGLGQLYTWQWNISTDEVLTLVVSARGPTTVQIKLRIIGVGSEIIENSPFGSSSRGVGLSV